ncbi:MAG: uracil phosphoribosyltransferase [Alphaproteobacteria bacterium]|nr:uracil phosphoribosyltransferase [Alphaproteobacteria bacterium]
MPDNDNVFVLDHPLVGTYLDQLRDKDSNSENFRCQVRRLGHMLALQITNDLNTKEKICHTPLTQTSEQVVCEKVGVVPILRAGIGLVDPFLDFLPEARALYLGIYRDEKTHQPVSYYNKLEETQKVAVAYIIDPMLATGGSALAAAEALTEWGIDKIKFAGLIGAPEGVAALHAQYPDIEIHLAALDENLNENAYIVPGLGDAGDRIFNT